MTLPGGSLLAEKMIEISRSLRAELPVPRGSPFYGLDHDMPYPVELLQCLSTQGIFRKYEMVLELESGFGGRARWAARQFGCRVLGVDPSKAVVRVAQELGAHGRTLHEAVFCVGRLQELPFPNGAFTHVWWLWPRSLQEQHGCLLEACRVLRDGGYFAWIAAGDGIVGTDTQKWLGEIGFQVTETRTLDVGRVSPWRSLVRRKLEQALRSTPELLEAWSARGRELREGERLTLLFARRRAKRGRE